MPALKITAVGGLSEKYLKEAQAEYQKRLSRFFNLEIKEQKEQRIFSEGSASEIEKALLKEAGDVLPEMKGCYNIALCVEGKSFSSEQFAALLSHVGKDEGKKLNFIIGSSFGLHASVKKAADLMLSFSSLTFPHQLMRIILLEQLFRASKINENEKYHK